MVFLFASFFVFGQRFTKFSLSNYRQTIILDITLFTPLISQKLSFSNSKKSSNPFYFHNLTVVPDLSSSLWTVAEREELRRHR